MSVVHIYISTGRFRSFGDMRRFIDETYTDDGDGVPSPFMREVKLESYEPACIEAIAAPAVMPIAELLRDASYSHQWLPKLDHSRTADSAICVFEPNRVLNPTGCSLEYLGAFTYAP